MPEAIFTLGHVVATPGALDRAKEHDLDLRSMLVRHASGDWGECDAHDKRENQKALLTGARILSVYGEDDQKIWIITDAAYPGHGPTDRQVTTILRPEDY